MLLIYKYSKQQVRQVLRNKTLSTYKIYILYMNPLSSHVKDKVYHVRIYV